MNKIITDARELVKQPHDPYWDAPITRREVQQAVNDIAQNENALSNMQDTCNIILNLVCQKLNITRPEIDAYVESLRGKLKPAEAANERPQG